MLSIAAFTFKYDHLEDRILVVGNLNNGQQRVDFWLTRKLVLRLLGGAQELIEKTSSQIAGAPAEHKAPLVQFDHEQAQTALPVEREGQNIDADLGNLLTRIDISYKQEKYQLLFFSHEADPIAASVLSYDELHQIFHLIHKGAVMLEWGVSDVMFESKLSPKILQ